MSQTGARAVADRPHIEDQAATATDETQSADEPVDGFTLEDALKTVLITNKNDGDAWAALQSAGATDPEIRSTLTNLVGLEKRVCIEKGICAISVEPKLGFWFGNRGLGNPTLPSRELVDAIRSVLAIPWPSSTDADTDDVERAVLADADCDRVVLVGTQQVISVAAAIEVEQIVFRFDFIDVEPDDAAVIKKCVAGARVGNDPLTTKTVTFERSKVRSFPDVVQELIAETLKGGGKSKAQSTKGNAPTRSKRAVKKATARAKPKPVRNSSRLATRKPAVKKKGDVGRLRKAVRR